MIYYAETFLGLKCATAKSPERAALRVARKMDTNDTIRAWTISEKEKKLLPKLPSPGNRHIHYYRRVDYDAITTKFPEEFHMTKGETS